MTVKDLHREAMKFNDLAIIAQKENPTMVVDYYKKAFELERKAFVLFSSKSSEEPTRTILIRSAANLAILSGQSREAEKLISIGLAGEPPDELAEELRDILQQVNFHRHLELKGIELDSNELQFSLSGNEVGHGIIRSDEFLSRIEIIEKLAYRTANRLRKEPFKEKGRRKKKNVIEFKPYLSVPRAASFAVTIRFGQSLDQINLPGMENQAYLIDDILSNIESINKNNYDQINKKISDDSYRRNFIALIKQLAPDGDRIKLVGFTVKRNNETITVPLTRIKNEFKIDEKADGEPQKESVEIIGTLSFADSKKSKIKLTDENNKDHIISVPQGLLSDVVKPYFEENVKLRGTKIGEVIELKDIDLIE